jgi:MFS family permease
LDADHKRHRARTLWLTGTLHAFTHLYGLVLIPLYLMIQADLKLATVEQATLLVTIFGAAYFLPSYPLGALADRVSRKRLMGIGLAINSLGFIALALAPNYPLAAISVIIGGFGGSFYHPAATALIARLFPEARGKALGLVGIGASAGFFLGPIYSGWRAAATGNWRAPVMEVGVAGLVTAGLFAWLADEERDPVPAGTAGMPKTGRPTGLEFSATKGGTPIPPKLFPTRALWGFFLAASVLFSLRDFAGSAMATASSLFLQSAHGFSTKLAGQALSGIFIASVISNPLFGRLSDGNRMKWVSIVMIVAAVMVGVFPHLRGLWMEPVLVTYGFFFLASYPITEAALMESVPDAVRGRVFGLFITISGLLSNLSHWAVGAWVEHIGPGAGTISSYYPLYTALAVLILLSLGALPFLHGLRKREHLEHPHATPAPLSALH